jgi:hypothetical protein
MNLIPIVGILFWNWKVFPIIFLFWTENLIIGAFNIIKLLLWSPRSTQYWKTKARIVPFFCLHYGLFALVHGILILIIFGGLFANGDPLVGFPDIGETLKNQGSIWNIAVSLFNKITLSLANYISTSVSDIWINLNVGWGVAGLAVSHGVSLIINYIGKGEYTRGDLNQLMVQPYTRVIILHIVIMMGGFLVMLTGAQAIGLILLVALKIYIDLIGHLKQHSFLNSEDPSIAGLIS